MNLWQCDKPGCKSTAVGNGGAIGLRAIGWWFVPGFYRNCYCPAHRPDGSPVPHEMHGDEAPLPCPSCAAEYEAAYLQDAIPGLLERYSPPQPERVS